MPSLIEHKGTTCPECNSKNVQFSDKKQAYVCVDCLHTYTIAPSTPPRIFISYARSDGEEFARNLRHRLVEEYVFSVWQDHTEIEVGKAWWQQIETALTSKHIEYLVLVMTKAKMESEMVCKECWLAIGRNSLN